MNFREHYIAAHKNWFSKQYPESWKDGFWSAPKFPKVATANGLTQWILNFLNWNGHRATRISSSGRQVAGKWVYGTTRKGTADISATIKGRSVMIEVKVGKDRPSPDQLKEQAKERAAGGLYEFIRTPEEFLDLYRGIILTITK